MCSGKCKSHCFSSVFGLYQPLRKIADSLAAKCSPKFTTKLLTLSVCLSFGAELVMHAGFLELFHGEKLPAAKNNAIRSVKLNQYGKAVGQTAKC